MHIQTHTKLTYLSYLYELITISCYNNIIEFSTCLQILKKSYLIEFNLLKLLIHLLTS